MELTSNYNFYINSYSSAMKCKVNFKVTVLFHIFSHNTKWQQQKMFLITPVYYYPILYIKIFCLWNRILKWYILHKIVTLSKVSRVYFKQASGPKHTHGKLSHLNSFHYGWKVKDTRLLPNWIEWQFHM